MEPPAGLLEKNMFKIDVKQSAFESSVSCEFRETKAGIECSVGGYFLFTLLHSGVLVLHSDIRTDHIKTDDEGYIEIEKQ